MAEPERRTAVAVIVPVFNRFDLLKATVSSLRAQTLADAEFILVDDGSDERVWRFLQTLPALDKRFTVIRKPADMPRGGQASRNIGLDASSADALVFLDSDDLLAPTCLADRLQALKAEPGTDILIGRQAIFSDTDQDLRWVNLPRAGIDDKDRFLRLAGPVDVPWVTGGVMIRSIALRECGVRWRPEFYWDDVAFHFECLMRGLTAAWMRLGVPADFYYRQHEGERFGRALFTGEGIRNTADMIVWMAALLESEGELIEARRRILVRSFFHACVLRALDGEKSNVAADVIERVSRRKILKPKETRHMRIYKRGRDLVRGSRRLTYYWNRLSAGALLASCFSEVPGAETYSMAIPQAVEARPALERILRATSDYSLDKASSARKID